MLASSTFERAPGSARLPRASGGAEPTPGPNIDNRGSFFGQGGPPFPRPPRKAILALTLILHVAAVAAVVLVPLYAPEPLVDASRDYIQVLIYDPPPPPPPPLPKGSSFAGTRARAPQQPEIPRPPSEASFTAPRAAVLPDEGVGVTVDSPGSPTGSESGVPEGMEDGVEGGVVGGVPGGVLGGVIGGTGTGPVPVRDFDRPPRVLRQIKPRYPDEAFIKKVQGTVMLEIVIDESGHVARVRVVQSVPLLDAAAVETVRQWTFLPAVRRGTPVAAVAFAPVTFRIY
jgi:protein TonB